MKRSWINYPRATECGKTMNDIEGFCGIFEMKPIRNCPDSAARNNPLGLALGLKKIIARGRLDRASQSQSSMRSIAARCPAFTRGYNIWHPCRGDELIWYAISDMRSTHSQQPVSQTPQRCSHSWDPCGADPVGADRLLIQHPEFCTQTNQHSGLKLFQYRF